MQIGYARVSGVEQNIDLQVDALKSAGCKKIFSDKMSGARSDRAGLVEAVAHGREGDVLVVWRLDRLGRSLPHLIATIHDLEERGIGFRSLTEAIDTTTTGGTRLPHFQRARRVRAQFDLRTDARWVSRCSPTWPRRGSPAQHD